MNLLNKKRWIPKPFFLLIFLKETLSPLIKRWRILEFLYKANKYRNKQKENWNQLEPEIRFQHRRFGEWNPSALQSLPCATHWDQGAPDDADFCLFLQKKPQKKKKIFCFLWADWTGGPDSLVINKSTGITLLTRFWAGLWGHSTEIATGKHQKNHW